MERRKISFDDALTVGHRLGIDFDVVDPMEFQRGIWVELEHGEAFPKTDIIPKIQGHDDLDVAGQIAYRHLLQNNLYYTKLYKYVDQD